ncbi:MAG: deoxynucleoside kinase [Bacteroidetes bacterium]|nr:MAG: deoxynucleoside kinase [Bacteroidota bacterium]
MYYNYFFKNIQIQTQRMESVVCIDGVVGAGKTTLGEILAQDLGLVFFREPVDNNPLLSKFYHDQERYSFPMQIYFLNKRFKMLKESQSLKGCVMDRSIYGDVIFARLLLMENKMSQEEFDLYEDLLKNMLEHVAKPQLMVYLDITVDNAIARIKERGRDYEQAVPRRYWEQLNEQYNEYFNHYNFSELLVLDVNKADFRKSGEVREYVLDKIKSKLLAETVTN